MDLAEAGEQVTLAAVESRLDQDSQKALLSSAIFADTSEEVFSREQAKLYVEFWSRRIPRLRADDLRTELKQAEQSGNRDEALRLMAELTQLQQTSRGDVMKSGAIALRQLCVAVHYLELKGLLCGK